MLILFLEWAYPEIALALLVISFFSATVPFSASNYLIFVAAFWYVHLQKANYRIRPRQPPSAPVNPMGDQIPLCATGLDISRVSKIT